MTEEYISTEVERGVPRLGDISDRYNVMLDPSVLLHQEGLQVFIDEAPRLKRDGANIFLPQALKLLLDGLEQDTDEVLLEQFVTFYVEDVDARVSLRRLSNEVNDELTRLPAERRFHWFRPDPEREVPPHLWFRYYVDSDLQREGLQNQHLLEAIFQEWVFLHERSWITSRTRRVFDAMIKAGGVCIEHGRRGFERAVRKTRKKEEQEALTWFDKLASLGKWTAAGGAAATAAGLLTPAVGIKFALEISPLVFALIDP